MNEEWTNADATWELLGKAKARPARDGFVDDVLAEVQKLPVEVPWSVKIIRFTPWLAAAACGVIAAFVLLDPAEQGQVSQNIQAQEESWIEIGAQADEQLLVAAADHLDQFSDQELVTLIGF